MANKRVFYAIYQVGITTPGSTTFTPVHGVQSLGITTTFNLEQVFELGQVSIYANIENIPEVEVTIEKVLDGYCPVYLLATQGAPTATLVGRANQQCTLGASIFSDQQDASSGTPLSQVTMSGMFVSSVSYSITVDGNATEAVTLVGNNKSWNSSGSGYTFTGAFTDTDAPIGLGGVNRRQHVLFDSTASTLDVNNQAADLLTTILPPDIPGISSSGTNNRNADGTMSAKLQSFSANVNLGRDEIFELGNKAQYTRYAVLPAEVTSEIGIISLKGDLVNAVATGDNTVDRSINFALKEGLRLNLGTKNRLVSTNMNGADAQGGNQTITFNYRTFSSFTCTHTGDVTVALRPAG